MEFFFTSWEYCFCLLPEILNCMEETLFFHYIFSAHHCIDIENSLLFIWWDMQSKGVVLSTLSERL